MDIFKKYFNIYIHALVVAHIYTLYILKSILFNVCINRNDLTVITILFIGVSVLRTHTFGSIVTSVYYQGSVVLPLNYKY